MNRYFLALVALFAASAAFGQQKIGYADTDYIISQLPDARKVDTELQAHGTQLRNQLEAKGKDYEKKLADLQANADKWVDAVLQDKQRELQQLQVALQKFQEDAEASYQKKFQDLMMPIYDKIGKTIAEVSTEQAYTFIITQTVSGGGGNVLLYKDPQYDISPLVLKKLGITPTAAATPPTTTKPQPK